MVVVGGDDRVEEGHCGDYRERVHGEVEERSGGVNIPCFGWEHFCDRAYFRWIDGLIVLLLLLLR